MKVFFKILIITGISILIPVICFAQHWQAAGDSCYVSGGATRLLTDTIHNRVYCSGNLIAPHCPGYTVGVPASNCYGYSCWDGSTWISVGDSLPPENDHQPLCMYHDTLISSYFYLSYAEQYTGPDYIGKWTGSVWNRGLSDSTDGIVDKLKVINGRLYAAGYFGSIGNINTINVAYKDSLGWHAIDTTTWNPNYGLVDVEEYNGGIYICGNFQSRDGTISRLAKWNGTHWSNVGGTMFNQSMDGAEALCKYNGYLYVGGYFSPSMGDPGNSIARWNDTIWEPLGTGLVDSFSNPGQVQDMKVINGKLVISGGFSFANGIPAVAIVEWDGSRFCSFGGNFDNSIANVAGFGNEIMITGPAHIYDTYAGDTIYTCNPARWVGGSYRESCSEALGVKQVFINTGQLNIYPNPNNGSFVIETNGNAKQSIQVFDVNGKLVLTQSVNGRTNVDASSLTEGVYNVSIISNEGVVNKRLVIVR